VVGDEATMPTRGSLSPAASAIIKPTVTATLIAPPFGPSNTGDRLQSSDMLMLRQLH